MNWTERLLEKLPAAVLVNTKRTSQSISWFDDRRVQAVVAFDSDGYRVFINATAQTAEESYVRRWSEVSLEELTDKLRRLPLVFTQNLRTRLHKACCGKLSGVYGFRAGP